MQALATPRKTRKLIIVGDSAFAEIAREYFEVESEYEVVAFSVETAYLKQERLLGLPVVDFDALPGVYDTETHDVFVAVVYTQLNRLRARLADQAKRRGYRLASFVSPHAFVWRNVTLGEHCFVFEDNTLQPFVTIGDNVVLWSGNHVGHHSTIGDNCFISSHVVISGFCTIGRNSFLGVNATLANNVSVAEDNWIGPGVTLVKDTRANQLFGAVQPEPSRVEARRFFKIKD